MASIKELRIRIRSIGNIKQITRAMEMVATTKLRRFQDRATSSRPYSHEVAGMVGRLASVLGDKLQDRPLFRKGEGDRILLLLVTSDRGLCGAYNSNLFRVMENWAAEQDAPVDYFVYGRKGQQYLSKRDFNLERFLVEPALEATDYRSAATTARMLSDEFLSGKYREVHVLYTAFESMVKYVPTNVQLLPIDGGALAQDQGDDDEGSAAATDVILEPDADTIFDALVPRYLETRLYNALLEALTSEYASRRFAMKNATDAADDMQKVLKGIYNKKRQEGITKDLLDIVGGAEAVK